MNDAPLIAIDALVKDYGGSEPLRIDHLDVRADDRITLSGLGADGAEMLMLLVTGAALPDEGEVRIEGRATRDIGTDTEWLQSLDRFGMVTARAVLFEELPVAASLALPLSLSIDPMPAEVRRQVESLADLAGLTAGRLDAPARALSPAERMQVHLARAMALSPRLVLLERPTDDVASATDRQAVAAALRRAAETRGFGWLAVTDDPGFPAASASRHLRLARGAVADARRWRWPWQRSGRA